MEETRVSQLQMDPQMNIEQEHMVPYPDPDERGPSYPPTPDERPPYSSGERSSYLNPEQPETPSGAFRTSLSQKPESSRGRNRKQKLVGPAKEFENARGNMATNVSRRRTTIKATQQYQDATEEHQRFLLEEAKHQIEEEL
jgi:hypothetical protein